MVSFLKLNQNHFWLIHCCSDVTIDICEIKTAYIPMNLAWVHSTMLQESKQIFGFIPFISYAILHLLSYLAHKYFLFRLHFRFHSTSTFASVSIDHLKVFLCWDSLIHSGRRFSVRPYDSVQANPTYGRPRRDETS